MTNDASTVVADSADNKLPTTPAPRPSFWNLVAGGEPYRFLFPLGLALGIFGVMLWPLHIWGVLPFYPGTYHARIMIEGFLTAFVIGFLGTALPRLLDVPRFQITEIQVFAVSLVAMAWLHFKGQTLWGDIMFLGIVAGFTFLLVLRFLKRKDTPPPGFILVGLGVLCAILGAGSQVIASIDFEVLPAWALTTGKLFLYQGYLLLPIMGIGAFLLPRFFDLPNQHDFPESLSLPKGWIAKAIFAAGCGAVVVASFVVEAAGSPRWGYALRALGVAVYMLREVPFLRRGTSRGTLATGLRISLLSVPVGFLLMAIWPDRISSFIHIVMISGFSLLTLVVASRVVLGHSGQSSRLRTPLWSLRAVIFLIVLAMLTRVSADWMPDIRLSHYAYAALAWAAAAIVWAVTILPAIRIPDSDE